MQYIKGDAIDMMLANFLKSKAEEGDPLLWAESIQYIGEGFYMFGNTKVHLRCINDRLVGTKSPFHKYILTIF
jgi:hypothetical protein